MVIPNALGLFAASLLLICFANTCTITNLPAVQMGNYVVVCAKVDYSNAANATGYAQYYFKTTLDQFSALTMKGLASAFTTLGSVNYAKVTLYFQNSSPGTSFVLIDNTKGNSIQRHFLSFVVNLNQGSLDSIVGDNFCDGSCVCHNDECFQSSTSGYGTSDATMYISWAGLDSNGKSLLSSSKRLSRFSLYSVSSVYDAVKSSLGY